MSCLRPAIAAPANPLRAALHVGTAAARTSAPRDILVRVGLAGTEGKLAGSLPLGQMKRLEVARALAVDPQIILFDEPLAGLNQTEAATQVETIAEVMRRAYGRAGRAQSGGGDAQLPASHRAQRRPRDRRRRAARGVMADPAVHEAYVGSGTVRMLGIENLNCGYGSVRAVHDVSFEVPAGSVFALLGPNGAGKTSTIMAIMGHVDIYAGRILFDDADITRRRAVDRVALGIALVPEGPPAFHRSHGRVKT
jgi:ABC-type branched-subunit amino acid transport system ATPase component